VRLALHISKADNGLKATLDSVDEGVSGIPLDSVKLADSKLSFTLKGQTSYDGKVDAAGTAIEGEFVAGDGWTPVNFRRGTVAKVDHKPANPTDIDGDWTGTAASGHEANRCGFPHHEYRGRSDGNLGREGRRREQRQTQRFHTVDRVEGLRQPV
jgi:hypothetical protein